MKEESELIKKGFEDMGNDSFYPLVTNDASKKVDCVIKINQEQLNNVFDPNNNPKFNL